ncbi:restriction endonuclease type II-like protein [Pelagophyceae sp. CCMP2097]|nr:restriction endonuclease type II-like protein [Pelagophyceae sp. CCMP2097]
MSEQQLLVSERQRGNAVLEHLRNVPWRFEKDIAPDYVLAPHACAIFISVRYHLLKPLYLGCRLAELRRDWRLRVLLCLVDVANDAKPLHDLNVAAVRGECTLLLAHSARECAQLLECFKAYEHNDARAIKAKVESDPLAQLADALTAVKPVNRTDVVTLARTFGSLKGIVDAPLDKLRACPGLGDKKVARLHDVFNQPFSHAARRRRQEKRRRDAADGATDEAGGAQGGAPPLGGGLSDDDDM